MSFVRNVISMMFNRLAGAVLAIFISALSARILTPAELGSIVAAVASVALLMRLVSLGLGQSAQFYGALESKDNIVYSQALLAATVPATAISFAVLLLLGPQAGNLILAGDPVGQKYFEELQYGIPLTLIHFVASLYVLGKREMRRYFWISVLPLVASVLVLVWGVLARKGIHTVVLAWQTQFVLSFLLGILLFTRRDNRSAVSFVPSLVAIYRYGLKSYVVSMAAFAAGRISLIMGAWFTLSAEVGVFAVGRTFAEALLLVYGAVGPLILSYVGSMDDPKDCQLFIGRVCRLSFLLFSVLSVAIALLAPIGISLIFGDQYSDSYLVVWLLLPGLIFSALQRILENYLYGRAKQASLVFVHAASIILLVGCGALLAPYFGAIGLAMACTLTFVASFIFTAAIVYQTEGLNPNELVIPRIADFHFLMNHFRRLYEGLWK